jgi:TM2 domain-containing membrane protein YozV
MNKRTVVAMILAYVVPGAGHFYLGHRARAAAFFAIIATLFLVGLRLDAVLYTIANSHRQILGLFAAIGSMGSGALYLFGQMFGGPGDFKSYTFEYGRMFTLTAGLMNLLLVIDCYDISVGRKP